VRIAEFTGASNVSKCSHHGVGDDKSLTAREKHAVVEKRRGGGEGKEPGCGWGWGEAACNGRGIAELQLATPPPIHPCETEGEGVPKMGGPEGRTHNVLHLARGSEEVARLSVSSRQGSQSPAWVRLTPRPRRGLTSSASITTAGMRGVRGRGEERAWPVCLCGCCGVGADQEAEWM
jgi:hypothetical protein